MKKFLVICSLLFLASAQVFALEVVNNRSEILLKEGVSYNRGPSGIEFYEVLKAAIDNSYDIDSALVNIEISKQQLKSAKREYIPTLNLRLNTEYAKGLRNNAYGIYSIGDTIINENTKYQDAATLSLQHTLIDYGAKKYKVNIAKNDIEQKEILYYQNIRDLKIKILDIYTRVLSGYLQIEECKYQARVYDEIYSMQKRLYGAGLISNIEVKSAKAQKLSVQAAQENLKIDFYENLAELSFYTNQDYGAEALRVGAFKFLNNEVDLNEFDFKKSPEYLAYQKEIEKRKMSFLFLRPNAFPVLLFIQIILSMVQIKIITQRRLKTLIEVIFPSGFQRRFLWPNNINSFLKLKRLNFK